jgi:hypothetical protein
MDKCFTYRYARETHNFLEGGLPEGRQKIKLIFVNN